MLLKKDKLDILLNQYIGILKNIYKDKLLKVVLFGSYARGDAREDSDIDIFAIIDMDDDTLTELHSKLLDDTWNFMCDNDYIHIQIIDESASYYNRFKDIEMLFRNISEDGVVYYEK